MTVMSPFHYENSPNQSGKEGALIVVLPHKIQDKCTLLESLATTLAFPPYFGHNWDALFECLRDFSWIRERDIVLVHAELPGLPKNELRIYLRLLRDSVLDWCHDESHHFEVVFSESDKETVESLLCD